MKVMQTFDTLQSQQNAIFGHRLTSTLSVFDSSPTSDRTFDTFSEMLANDGSDKNREFSRLYGNGGDGMKPSEHLNNVGDVWS